MSAFVFLPEPGESAGARMARCAREACEAGPMGAYLDAERYRGFLSVWGGDTASLSRVRTSCAIFSGGVKAHCGGKIAKPWHADGSWGINAWLSLGFGSAAWVASKGQSGPRPPVGSILYWGSKTGSNGHVGVLVEWLPNGLARTCEGGGSPGPADIKRMLAAGASQTQAAATNGTVCRMSAPEGKSIWTSAGRALAGWWHPDMIGLPDPATADTEPAPPPSSQPPPVWVPPSAIGLKRNDINDTVKIWQLRLRAAGHALPKSFRTGQPDGHFGDETERATRAVQRDNLLPQTGVVDRATWEHAEAKR